MVHVNPASTANRHDTHSAQTHCLLRICLPSRAAPCWGWGLSPSRGGRAIPPGRCIFVALRVPGSSAKAPRRPISRGRWPIRGSPSRATTPAWGCIPGRCITCCKTTTGVSVKQHDGTLLHCSHCMWTCTYACIVTHILIAYPNRIDSSNMTMAKAGILLAQARIRR